MPELPEVEITRRLIAPHLVGRTIESATTTPPSYFFITQPARLRKELPGRCVERLDRHGKYLLAVLDDGRRLLLHLGMTGQLLVSAAADPAAAARPGRTRRKGPHFTWSPALEHERLGDLHTHLRLSFADGGASVCFRDARKFGKVQLLSAGERCERLDKLGVDALSATGAHLHAATRGRRAAIKNVLLDQGVLSGVGNIYADEGLFLAGIRPRTRADRLSRPRCERLVAAVQQVMLRSIETGGSSISDYVHPDGGGGGYQHERKVYARQGEPCRVCGALVARIVLGQRSAHYCPHCQR